MVNPVSSANVSHAIEAAKPAPPKAQPTQQTQQKSSPQPSDTVKLKSTGDANHGGDSH
jgi:hypothetical protein